MAKMLIDGQEVEFIFSMLTVEMIEEKWGSMAGMYKKIQEKPQTTMLELAAMMTESSAQYHGTENKFTKKWFSVHVSPMRLPDMMKLLKKTMEDGNNMEVHDQANGKPQDVVLEELEKKTGGR